MRADGAGEGDGGGFVSVLSEDEGVDAGGAMDCGVPVPRGATGVAFGPAADCELLLLLLLLL